MVYVKEGLKPTKLPCLNQLQKDYCVKKELIALD